MPTERELSIRYNVSRVTVRDTLNRLAQAGYIYRIQGKGTFVSVRKIEKKLTKLYTLRKRFEEKGVVHEVKTLQFEVISPSDDIREKLEIIENEDVYKLIRCFYASIWQKICHQQLAPTTIPQQNRLFQYLPFHQSHM